jgi:cell division protein FtsQ
MTSTLSRSPSRIPPRGRRLRWQTVARFAALPAVLIAAGVYLLGFSSVLGVRTVRVTGLVLLTEQQVLDTAAIPHGSPLLRLDTGAVAARLRALPEVASVRVTTRLPSTVAITVSERVGVGYLAEGAKFEIYDSSDVGFRLVGTKPKTVPELVAGSQPDGPEALAAAQVAGDVGAGIRARLTSVSAATTQSVTLILRDGRIVLWGGTDRDADKAKLLPVLLKQPGKYFDISDPSTVVSRPNA